MLDARCALVARRSPRACQPREHLYAGELFGTGTLPGGSGIENGQLLERGDIVRLAIDGVGTLSNRIV
jgi:2-keto-4-pentenoate hydratase/2-oxohepta-3-ene-1,7-dioic acid hydratase in catechol pathway